MSSASSISASVISFAPASTIRMASCVPATTRSRSAVSCCSSVGLTTKLPSTLPIRTAPTGVGNGMLETIRAAGAPLALEERAGDLAGRVHPLLDVHRERHEVDVAQVPRRRSGEDAGVAGGDEDGAG